MTMALFYIGLDDTDNDTSPGTGQLARRLAREAETRGAAPKGITRHQFLVDDRIPYTSHNSGACLAVEWTKTIDELDFAFELIAEWAADGSDPGVCVLRADAVPHCVTDFGWRATRDVLTTASAIATAKAANIRLRALGGTGQGVIGALSSVGLRADGNEGRFLELPGLRELNERVSLNELARVGIEVEHIITSAAGSAEKPVIETMDHDRLMYKTMNWVRPRLTGGKAVWPVQWSDEYECWIAVDKKRSRPLE
jgi:hypothetical protein